MSTKRVQATGRKLSRVLFHFQNLRAKAPILVLDILSHVAAAGEDGLPMRELAGLCNRPQTSISRVILHMLTKEYRGEPGPDLVVAEMDPEDYRQKIVKLTPRGRKLMEEIAEIL